MYKRKKRKAKLNYFRVGVAVSLLVLIIIGIVFIFNSCSGDKQADSQPADLSVPPTEASESVDLTEPATELQVATMPIVFYPELTENSVTLPPDYDSKYAILMDADTGEIIAYRNYNTRMFPASLTKVMTLIVALENIDDLSDTVLITSDMVDPMVEAHASRAGFLPGETPTLEQLLYGVILPSGADATLAVAQYVSGSEEAFVKLMNDKAEEMGLKNTHFTNASGLHNDNHYSTAEDMALILQYALDDPKGREILSTYQYQVPPTEFNPEGLMLTSTVFSRMTGEEMPNVTIKGGKTGFTDEAGQCLETFAEINGKTYIMVLAVGVSKWQIVYNTLSGYSIYCADGEAYIPPK